MILPKWVLSYLETHISHQLFSGSSQSSNIICFKSYWAEASLILPLQFSEMTKLFNIAKFFNKFYSPFLFTKGNTEFAKYAILCWP